MSDPFAPPKEPLFQPLSPLPPTPDPPPTGWKQNFSHLYRRQGNFLARIASAIEAGGVDHVLWGASCFLLHGIEASDCNIFHFIVPDDKIGKACALLLAAGAEPCRGERWCVVHNPPVGRPIFQCRPRPAQHIHEKCGGLRAWVCLHKHSKVLPKVPSLELSVPPPAGSPPSAWGVVSADVYRPFFFSWSRSWERPSLHPLRVLPPHKLCEAFLALMCRAEPYSVLNNHWYDQVLTVLCDYYHPGEWEEICELGYAFVAKCTFDPSLLPPAYRRWVRRIRILGVSRYDAENELRRAEGLPLVEPRRADNLPPLALGGDEEEYEGLQEEEKEEKEEEEEEAKAAKAAKAT